MLNRKVIDNPNPESHPLSSSPPPLSLLPTSEFSPLESIPSAFDCLFFCDTPSVSSVRGVVLDSRDSSPQDDEVSIPVHASPIIPLSSYTEIPQFQDLNLRLRARATTDLTCIGNGFDVISLGIISTLVLTTVVGLLIWVSSSIITKLVRLTRIWQLLFAFLRPRYRQVYGLREWFVQPELVAQYVVPHNSTSLKICTP